MKKNKTGFGIVLVVLAAVLCFGGGLMILDIAAAPLKDTPMKRLGLNISEWVLNLGVVEAAIVFFVALVIWIAICIWIGMFGYRRIQ